MMPNWIVYLEATKISVWDSSAIEATRSVFFREMKYLSHTINSAESYLRLEQTVTYIDDFIKHCCEPLAHCVNHVHVECDQASTLRINW